MTTGRLRRRGRAYLYKLLRTFRYHESSETVSLVVSAVVVGVLVGLAAVAFDRMVHHMGVFVHQTRVTMGAVWGPLVVMFIPAVGGLLVAPIVVKFAPDVRGSGIPSVILAVSNLGGRISKRLIFWRPLASTLSIGTGASLGTEGPVVQLGASIASIASDLMRLNDERRRTLVAVAAAGGIAASFNAPIAGVLFALEVVLGQFGNRNFSAVVIGSVSASAVSHYFLGDDPAFAIPGGYGLGTPFELPLYFMLGLACALVAVAFIRLVVSSEDVFNTVTGHGGLRISPWLRPALGGLLVGMLGLLLPEVLGRGYDTTENLLQGELAGLGFITALLLAKLAATSISLASWGSGGILAPILFIGAATGAAFGRLFQLAFPESGLNPGAFALVGMGAVFSGATRAPMSSIVMIFEMSGDYGLILPLLLAAVAATLVADVFHPESIYHVILSRKGLSLLKRRERDLLQTVTVREVMDDHIPVLSADDTLQTLRQHLSESRHTGFVVTASSDPDHIFGIVTLSDLERARQSGLSPQTTLHEVCQRTVHCAVPDEPISEVLERMAHYNISRMPVVHPRDRRRATGYVSQSHLARAYYQALRRERTHEQGEEERRLRDLTGQEIVEVRVRPRSPLAGKTLREAGLPEASIVVAIRRRGRTVFPHGDTRLEPDDTVVANVAPGTSRAFRDRFSTDTL